MESVPPENDLTELLEHASWARELARGLVADAGVAEDLVQEAWVAALERPPERSGSLRGWLGRVIRNRARMHGRGRTRRSDREWRVAREGASEAASAADVAERFDAQHRLAARVLELREPYRTTVLLRYYEGLDATAIAARMGVPAGTVRWRLKVALDELRERLDDDFGGDRSAWVVLVLPLARREPAVAAGSGVAAGLVKGLFTLKLSTVIAGAALVAVAAFLFAPALREDSAPAADPVEPTAALSEELGQQTLAQAPQDPAPVSTRDEVREVVEAAQAPLAAPRTGLAARIVDPAGEPVEGARLTCDKEGAEEALTDADGRGLVLLPGLSGRAPLTLRATREGFFEGAWLVTAAENEVVDAGQLALEPCGVIEGRVFLADGGRAPLAWIEVAGGQGDELAGLPPSGFDSLTWERLRRSERSERAPVADERGEFRLKDVPLGVVRLWAGLEGELAVLSEPFEVRSDGTTTGVELRLGALAHSEVITGEVLLPDGTRASGAPLRVIAAGAGKPRELRADEDGRFRLICRGEVPVTVRVPSHTRFAPEGSGPEYREMIGDSVADLEGGEHIVLRLGETGSFEVFVTDGSSPVSEAQLELVDPDSGRRVAAFAQLSSADGRVVVSRPEEAFLLKCTADGYAVAQLGPFESSLVPARLTVELTQLPGLAGVVLAGGQPVAGARVLAVPAARVGVEHQGFPCLVDPSGEIEGESSEDGTFRLTPRKSRAWFVRAEAPGFAPAEVGPLEYDTASGLEGVELSLTEGGAIEGVVRGADGPLAGELVVASRGDGYVVSARTDSGGRYRLAHLIPGPWQVETGSEEEVRVDILQMGGEPHTREGLPSSCVVVEGETTAHDLELAQRPLVQGRLTLDGAGPGAWEASLVEESRPTFELVIARLDAEGRFELPGAGPGPARLLLRPTDGTRRILTCELELVEGELEWTADLSTGSLSLSGLSSPGEGGEVSLLVAEVNGPIEGLQHVRLLEPAPDGTQDIDALPTGSYTLRTGPMNEMMRGGGFNGGTERARFELRAGEVTEVRVE